MRVIDDMQIIEVRGLLSYFFPLNVGITETVAKTIVGLPIKNANHIVIGKIDSINWETGEWLGRIVVDGSIADQMCVGYKKSLEFVVEEGRNDS